MAGLGARFHKLFVYDPWCSWGPSVICRVRNAAPDHETDL